MTTPVSHNSMANAIRFLSIDAVEKANSGHPGLPMGAADIATVLFRDVLKFDAADPHWPDRDRFVLSAGHGSMLLYSLLYLTGVGGDKGLTIGRPPGVPPDRLEDAGPSRIRPHARRRDDDRTAGAGDRDRGRHGARRTHARRRVRRNRRPPHLCPGLRRRSDGGRQPGGDRASPAISRLAKLIVLYDDNGISIDGKTSLANSVDQLARFRSAGWRALRIDGHDPKAILRALRAAKRADKPTLIACKTTIGFGAPTRAGTNKAHGEALGAAEIAGARAALNWPYEPFVVPDEILAAWRAVGARGKRRADEMAAHGQDARPRAARRIRAPAARRSAQGAGRGGRRL